MLEGEVAIVTGASSGIGAATAAELGRRGAVVVLAARRADALEAQAEAIRAAGGRALAVPTDVTARAQLANLVDCTLGAFGRVDVLVNNAGLARPAAIDRVSAAEWDEAIAVNLTSAFLITQGVVAGMRARRWGRLIFLSSVAAQVGGVVGPHYAASKAGLHGLMHVYAAHLAKEGVTANAIAPALIETEMVTSNLNAKPGIIPVGRFGHVDEVASVVRLLAENAYLTGQTINVNGGWYPS
jgi:3-oxoacyl-[acyl-carrier protein] reductase